MKAIQDESVKICARLGEETAQKEAALRYVGKNVFAELKKIES